MLSRFPVAFPPPAAHDPLRRAALTIYGPGTQVAKEALYFGVAQLDGLPLTGAHDYTLTFPPKGTCRRLGRFGR